MTDPGDEVLIQYDYGSTTGVNALPLRGQTVTSTDSDVTTTWRNCYGYNALGRKISDTLPQTNLASCPATPPTTANAAYLVHPLRPGEPAPARSCPTPTARAR